MVQEITLTRHLNLVLFVQGRRPGKVLEIGLGPGKLLEFEKRVLCPRIGLEFCKIILENMNESLKNIKYN